MIKGYEILVAVAALAFGLVLLSVGLHRLAHDAPVANDVPLHDGIKESTTRKPSAPTSTSTSTALPLNTATDSVTSTVAISTTSTHSNSSNKLLAVITQFGRTEEEHAIQRKRDRWTTTWSDIFILNWNTQPSVVSTMHCPYVTFSEGISLLLQNINMKNYEYIMYIDGDQEVLPLPYINTATNKTTDPSVDRLYTLLTQSRPLLAGFNRHAELSLADLWKRAVDKFGAVVPAHDVMDGGGRIMHHSLVGLFFPPWPRHTAYNLWAPMGWTVRLLRPHKLVIFDIPYVNRHHFNNKVDTKGEPVLEHKYHTDVGGNEAMALIKTLIRPTYLQQTRHTTHINFEGSVDTSTVRPISESELNKVWYSDKIATYPRTPLDPKNRQFQGCKS